MKNLNEIIKEVDEKIQDKVNAMSGSITVYEVTGAISTDDKSVDPSLELGGCIMNKQNLKRLKKLQKKQRRKEKRLRNYLLKIS